jgi:hypothetical protein
VSNPLNQTQQCALIALGIISKASVQADDETQNAVAATKNMLKGIANGQLVVTPVAIANTAPGAPVPQKVNPRAPKPGPAAKMSK